MQGMEGYEFEHGSSYGPDICIPAQGSIRLTEVVGEIFVFELFLNCKLMKLLGLPLRLWEHTGGMYLGVPAPLSPPGLVVSAKLVLTARPKSPNLGVG